MRAAAVVHDADLRSEAQRDWSFGGAADLVRGLKAHLMGVRVKFWKGASWQFINHQGRRRAKKVVHKTTALELARKVRARRRYTLHQRGPHEMRQRIGGVFPQVLLDRAASVRGLARFVAARHQLGLIPRAVYAEALVANLPGQLASAIEGVGETGTVRDVGLIVPPS